MPRLAFLVIAVGLTAATAGCTDAPPGGPLAVYPTKGRILYKGKPVARALVAFHPAGAAVPKPGDNPAAGPPRPTAQTDADGNFALHTYVGDDGAPEGSYKVTVSLATASETREFMKKQAAAPASVLRSLPTNYADPSRTDLAATIKPGENALPPFDLKDAPSSSATKPGGFSTD